MANKGSSSKSGSKTVRYRDAGNGQYIRKEKALKNPATTVRETDKKKKR